MKNYINITPCEKQYLKWKIKTYKSKKFKRFISITILINILIIFLVTLYLTKVVNPIIYDYSNSSIQKAIVKSCNAAICEISNNTTYKDIIKVSYNASGEILSLEADAKKTNQISNNLAKTAQNEIDSINKLGINIPIGTCSGISLLSGKGNNLNISINPIGNASCNLITIFEDAGINQTNHKIYAEVKVEANLILPFLSKKISHKTNYLLAECIIVGKIPSVYLTQSII